MKTKSGLRKSLFWMILIPLALLGIIIIAYSSYYLTALVEDEVKTELKGIAQSVLVAYESTFPGEYYVGEDGSVYKGEEKLEDAAGGVLPGYKELFGADITVFYGDTRIATTIVDDTGSSIVGTTASDKVVQDVLNSETEQFYSSTTINNDKYVSYYAPFYNSSGECVGMIFAGKEARHVRGTVMKGLAPVFIVICIGVAVVIFIMWRYAGRMVQCMGELVDFFTHIEDGDMRTELGQRILDRTDELGQIGRSALQMQSSLRDLMERDALTGLYNRHYGEIWLQKTQKKSETYGHTFYVSIGDIDFFKKFNDNYGHDCGDMVLREVSRILKRKVTDKGYAVRWGGEEFLLILSGDSVEDAEDFVNQISDEIRSKKFEYGEQVLGVTMTFGLTDGNSTVHTDEIVKKADRALYEGKESGRNKVVYRH